MRRRATALLCAATAAFATGGSITAVHASVGDITAVHASVGGVGNQYQHLDLSPCHADFGITETPAQTLGVTLEPGVTTLTPWAKLSCDYPPGYPSASVHLIGLAGCTGYSPFTPYGGSAAASCTVYSPPPGEYEAELEVDWGSTGTIKYTFDETVLPGISVQLAVASPIGNQSAHFFDIAPCHMSGSITESPPQSLGQPLSPVSTITATALMTCDRPIFVANYVTVTLVSSAGPLCGAQTPNAYNSNTSFVASCSVPGLPGAYTAVFTYTADADVQCCGYMLTTAAALDDTIL
jgi:hypothetical protein